MLHSVSLKFERSLHWLHFCWPRTGMSSVQYQITLALATRTQALECPSTRKGLLVLPCPNAQMDIWPAHDAQSSLPGYYRCCIIRAKEKRLIMKVMVSAQHTLKLGKFASNFGRPIRTLCKLCATNRWILESRTRSTQVLWLCTFELWLQTCRCLQEYGF